MPGRVYLKITVGLVWREEIQDEFHTYECQTALAGNARKSDCANEIIAVLPCSE